jgi:chitodextrinase
MKPNKRFLALVLLAVLTVTGCLKSSGTVTGGASGKVYDSNGHVLRGAKVEIYGGNHVTISDELGRYTVTGVEPGQKKLVATYDKRSVVRIVEIPRGGILENTDLTFEVVDGLPPVITDVTVVNLGENAGTITWITNEAADSIVDYATGPVGLGPYTMQATDSAFVNAHSLTLTGLSPNVTYHFRVRSRDYSGNEGVSSDYQFTTPSGEAPAIPVGFAIAAPTEMERVLVSWNNNSESDLLGYNLYRAESKNGPFARVNANPISSSASGTSTTYRDDGLKVAAKYYYHLKAVDTAKNESGPTPVHSVVTPGTLNENRTWKVDESPYVVQGDIRVRGGSVLTIEPGVEVRCSQTDSMPDNNGATMTEIIVQGGMTAVGTADKRIIFTSASSFPQKANWGGIKFISTSQPENQMKFATVLFADTGVRSEGSTPTLENLEIGMCGFGLDIGLSTTLNIRYNTIRDCDVGLVSANSNIRNNLFLKNGVGVTLFGADLLEFNTIDSLTGVQIPFGEPIIRNNIIAYTGGRAIYGIQQTQTTATPTISFNDIFNFSTDIIGVTVATGPGNISQDPLFVGGYPFDYHLRTTAAGYASDSPCLNAGEGSTQMGRYGP